MRFVLVLIVAIAIGKMVGLSDITRAQPRALGALTDVYAADLHYRAPPTQIRAWYAARLRNAVDKAAAGP